MRGSYGMHGLSDGCRCVCRRKGSFSAMRIELFAVFAKNFRFFAQKRAVFPLFGNRTYYFYY